jgi:hypothetical protein
MSIAQNVVLHREKLPSPTAISVKAKELGFDLAVDNADLASHTGFLPCTFNGHKAGFEWYIDDTSICEELNIEIDDRDCVCTMVTHSDTAECLSAMVFAASLLVLTEGVFFDDYDNVETEPDRLLQHVREWMETGDA